MASDDPIRQEIERQEARLAALNREREEVRARLEFLRSKAATGRVEASSLRPLPVIANAPPSTPADKVALFRRFFRGRDDLFPRLWVNSRSGKKGYAPACSN